MVSCVPFDIKIGRSWKNTVRVLLPSSLSPGEEPTKSSDMYEIPMIVRLQIMTFLMLKYLIKTIERKFPTNSKSVETKRFKNKFPSNLLSASTHPM